MARSHHTEDSVGGESLISYNRRPRTYGAGRLCRFVSCTTRLSIYNSDDYCATHLGTDPNAGTPGVGLDELKVLRSA